MTSITRPSGCLRLEWISEVTAVSATEAHRKFRRFEELSGYDMLPPDLRTGAVCEMLEVLGLPANRSLAMDAAQRAACSRLLGLLSGGVGEAVFHEPADLAPGDRKEAYRLLFRALAKLPPERLADVAGRVLEMSQAPER